MPEIRTAPAAVWTAANPTLAYLEAGVEADTGHVRVGDGATPWTALPISGLAPAAASRLYPSSPIRFAEGGIVIEPAGAPPGGMLVFDAYGRPLLTGGIPTLAVGPAAASAAPGAPGLLDAGGSLTVTAPVAPTVPGVVAVLTFSAPYAGPPKSVQVTDTSDQPVGLYVSARSASGLTFSCRSLPAPSQLMGCDFTVFA